MGARLGEIWRYPVKSFRGASLEHAAVEPWGLAGDRRWMLVDPAGRAVTAREVNALLLAGARPVEGGLELTAPGAEPLRVAVPGPPGGGGTPHDVPVSLWSSQLTATPADAAAHAWCSAVAGREVRLVHLGDPTVRQADQRFAAPGDRVSLADGYPLLLTTEASLVALRDAVTERALERGLSGEEPLSMTRFRPNVVVTGTSAWAEDDWRRLRIGSVTFRAVKGCARCVMTTVDPGTAQRGPEPIASLARVRRWDAKTWFGVNLVPDLPGPASGPVGSPVCDPASEPPVVRVGDPVEVLEAVAPGGGPVRPAVT